MSFFFPFLFFQYISLPYALGLRGRAYGMVTSKIRKIPFEKQSASAATTSIGDSTAQQASARARLQAMRDAAPLSPSHPTRRAALWTQAVQQLSEVRSVS